VSCATTSTCPFIKPCIEALAVTRIAIVVTPGRACGPSILARSAEIYLCT
jgi:hypothetical protein